MCCGARSATRNAARSGATVQQRALPMTPAPARPSPPAMTVQFEYVGKTRLTVVSPTTGARYHFEAPGARLAVAPQDQAMMIHVPGLRPVRFVRG
jgi:hypothetical protein